MRRIALAATLAVAALGGGSAPSAATAPVANGRIAFASGRGCSGGADLYTARPDGSGVSRLTDDCLAGDPAWSPDGSTLAFTTKRDSEPEIWVMRADGTGLHQLSPAGLAAIQPAWSPDGKRLAFTGWTQSGPWGIYVLNADGTGLALVRSAGSGDPAFGRVTGDPSWSPDGTKLAFTAYSGVHYDNDTYVYTVNVDGSDLARLAVGEQPVWSPDGGTIAFASEYSDSLWLMHPDGGDQRLLVAPAGGAYEPTWSPDGTEIAFTGALLGSGAGEDVWTIPAAGGQPARVTADAADDGEADWQRLPGGVQLAGGAVSIPASSVFAPARLVLGPVALSPAHACARRPVRARIALSDTDGRLVHAAVVTVRSVPAGRIHSTSVRTGMLGGGTVMLRPVRRLTGRALLVVVSAGGATARRISIPVRC